jgi:hypothetical protein
MISINCFIIKHMMKINLNGMLNVYHICTSLNFPKKYVI